MDLAYGPPFTRIKMELGMILFESGCQQGCSMAALMRDFFDNRIIVMWQAGVTRKARSNLV